MPFIPPYGKLSLPNSYLYFCYFYQKIGIMWDLILLDFSQLPKENSYLDWKLTNC